jgi:hypothetical protein
MKKFHNYWQIGFCLLTCDVSAQVSSCDTVLTPTESTQCEWVLIQPETKRRVFKPARYVTFEECIQLIPETKRMVALTNPPASYTTHTTLVNARNALDSSDLQKLEEFGFETVTEIFDLPMTQSIKGTQPSLERITYLKSIELSKSEWRRLTNGNWGLTMPPDFWRLPRKAFMNGTCSSFHQESRTDTIGVEHIPCSGWVAISIEQKIDYVRKIDTLNFVFSFNSKRAPTAQFKDTIPVGYKIRIQQKAVYRPIAQYNAMPPLYKTTTQFIHDSSRVREEVTPANYKIIPKQMEIEAAYWLNEIVPAQYALIIKPLQSNSSMFDNGSKVQIMPTLVVDVLRVEGALYYEILNISGQLIWKGTQSSVDLQHLNAGFYLVRGRDLQGKPFLSKIVKQ